MGTPIKRGRGRPTKYAPHIRDQARKLALLGLTDDEMADLWGVARSTIKNWKHEHPEFLAALASGREAADADVAVSLFERAKGYSHPEEVIHCYQGQIIRTKVIRHYPPDVTACSIILRNRHRTKWAANPDPAGGNETPLIPQRVDVVDASIPDT